MKWLLMGTAALSLSTAAQADDRFDLICQGTKQEDLNGPKEPHSFRMIIDLEAMTFCKDECDTMWDIAEVDPAEIRFTANFEGSVTSDQRVSRRTGKYEWVLISTGIRPWSQQIEAQCSPAPFSGFPETQF